MFKYQPEEVLNKKYPQIPYPTGAVRWPALLFLILTPLAAVIAVPWYGFTHGYDMFEWGMFFVFMMFTGMSITAGYHRLWAHRTYQSHWLPRLFYAIGGAGALQNSIVHWAADHRKHHTHVDDNDHDPYSAKRGFWYSHIGWIYKNEAVGREDFSSVRDLLHDPIVAWQHMNYTWITLAFNIGLPVLIGFLHGDVLGTFLLAGLLRLVLNHHFTFFINSLAHIWGGQNYDRSTTARDNGFLALFTYGEGYHNYHHRFQYDYRNGHIWYHYDPAKWLIKSLSWVGMAKNLKKVSDLQIEQARIKTEYQRLLEEPHTVTLSEELRHRLDQAYQTCVKALEEYVEARKQWLQSKRQAADTDKSLTKKLKARAQALRSEFLEQRKQWRSTLAELSYAPAAA